MKSQASASIREFNRFYTGVIGLLDQHILDSPFSLAEARILYELYHRQPCTASDIMAHLPIDKGHLSRILDQFKKRALLTRNKSKMDGRASHLRLTHRGNIEFEKLNQASEQQIKSLLKKAPVKDQGTLVHHMNEIIKILSHTQ